MYKNAWYTCKVVVSLRNKPIAFFDVLLVAVVDVVAKALYCWGHARARR